MKIMGVRAVAKCFAFLILFNLCATTVRAQIPPFPVDPFLDSWSFYDPTNWLSDLEYAPIGFTNIVCDQSAWSSDDGVLDCNGLILDSTNAAYLNYKVVESDGSTNLICSAGTLWFWFSPDWSSENQSGTGPGDWGRFIDVGEYTTNAASGWWSIYLSPDGNNIYFSGGANGAVTNYLNYPISWSASSWHLIGLTYSATNSLLYVDGELATNGTGVLYLPRQNVLTNGFWIGSDSATGTQQARGEFVDLETYSDQFYTEYPTNYFYDYYNQMLPEISGSSGGFGGFGPDFMPPTGGFGGGGVGDFWTNSVYGTNLWLYINGVSNNFAGLFLMNTMQDVEYEIQSRTNLLQTDWQSEGFVYGPEVTNYVEMDVPQNNRTINLFFRIRSWVDSNNSGIPDWWWLTYFGQATNVDAFAADSAGDGYSNLQKFQMGLNPTNYYNPNPPGGFFGSLDASGTNAFLEWSNAPGPVINYIVQRGIEDTNGNYVYSQIGLVSSNVNFFEDVGAITNDNAQNNIYNLTTVYPGGNLSATDTWYAYYASYDFPVLPYGPPMPNDVYAYVNATGTNVQLSWTPPLGAAATNYIIERGVFDTNIYDYDYTQIGQTNTTSFQDVGVINNSNAWNDVYEVEAVYPGGVLSQPATSSINSTNPAPPTGLSATVDSTGTNVLLAWTPPSGGAVTNYIIKRGILNTNTGTYSYSQIGSVNGSTTSFEDAGAITSNNSYNNDYEVEAVDTGGDVSPFDDSVLPGPPAVVNDNIYITAYLIRNGTGRWQVMFSGFPTNAQTIALSWNALDFDTQTYADPVGGMNISTTNLINGVYQIPDTTVVNYLGDGLSVQLFGPNGEPGQIVQAGVLPNDAPYFVDGRQHSKQNLTFMIRAASIYGTFGSTANGDMFVPVPYNFNYYAERLNSSTNFEEFSFLSGNVDYENIYSWSAIDDLWPLTANYDLSNFIMDTSRTNYPDGLTNFNFTINFATNIPAPPMLNPVDPFWILQPGLIFNVYNPLTGVFTNNGSDWGLTFSDTNTVVSLQSGIKNLFGLSYGDGYAVDGIPQDLIYGSQAVIYQSLALGDTIPAQSITNGHLFFNYASQCPAPVLLPVNYYFAPLVNPNLNPADLPPVNQQPFPLPIDNTFAVTNQTPPVIVGSIGQPMILGAWAKYSISNSSPTKYAYLGQYFATNAFLLNTSGTVTTNSAGILSPYGEFFPTQAGQAALVTMPDIDTGQKGTGVVDVVALNVDANHDGTMDFTYSGPDQTSSSRPYRFWVNDDQDWSDDIGNGIPGQGAKADGVQQIEVQANASYFSLQNTWEVHGRRDLVDFFPVYLNIGGLFQSNVLSAGASVTDTNYQFILSQADGALRFAYTDLTPTNYINFLRDTNESGSLAYAPLTTITASGVTLTNTFLSSIATNNQGVILVEAWENTTQPLVLSIYHGTNLLAQTQLYLSISGVEQMFRHKNLLLNISPAMPDRLTDASVPNEPDTIDKNFVFVHGYNVNPQQARGWDADIYKRMYWSGSHAKFYGVTWEASDSQVGNVVTINLQTNIVNAFNTAPLLNTFLNSLTGTNVVAAHSLGNMLVLSTLNDCTNQNVGTYFMIDAAVAIEALQGNAPQDTNLVYPDWTPYTNWLYASHWWKLFPTTDARSTLTWNNRLENFGGAEMYNFYSSGEEVLREYKSSTDGSPPSQLEASADQVKFYIENELFNTGLPVGTYTWAWQEMLKGRGAVNGLLSSTHGGWQFSYSPAFQVTNGFGTLVFMSPSQALTLTTNEIQTNSFFNFNSENTPYPDAALLGSSGSTYAQANRNRIISDAIPCLTLPLGANADTNLDLEFGGTRNFDMQTVENGWPSDRPARTAGTTAAGEWHHSDCRQVAYTFTHNLFDDIVTFGGLQ